MTDRHGARLMMRQTASCMLAARLWQGHLVWEDRLAVCTLNPE